MEYTQQDLKNHLKVDHDNTPLSDYLKEIVYGGNDGIVTTFAVVAGFIGAQQANQVLPVGYFAVLLFGLANLFADGVSMGLGNFLSIRSEQDQYDKERKIELAHMSSNFDLEKAQTVFLLKKQGFTEDQSQELSDIYVKNPKYWADFMMRYELEKSEPSENPYLSGLATLVSFLFFGSIPLIPFMFLPEASNPFGLAVISTFSALTLLGILRWRITKLSVIRSVGEIVFVGGLSAIVAYTVGTFFKG